MPKYLGLLRGINVGGNNIISMKELKKVFENNHFTDVSTYINSGNIIFSSIKKEEEIKKESEELIFLNFNIKTSIMIISLNDYKEALLNVPDWWDKEKEAKHNAIFVIPPFNAKELVEQIGESDYERVAYYNQVIFWSALLKDFPKTKWSKAISTPLSKNLTIRNANTTKKLLKLLEEES